MRVSVWSVYKDVDELVKLVTFANSKKFIKITSETEKEIEMVNNR